MRNWVAKARIFIQVYSNRIKLKSESNIIPLNRAPRPFHCLEAPTRIFFSAYKSAPLSLEPTLWSKLHFQTQILHHKKISSQRRRFLLRGKDTDWCQWDKWILLRRTTPNCLSSTTQSPVSDTTHDSRALMKCENNGQNLSTAELLSNLTIE